MIAHCVRHGESEFNSEGRVQGHLDVPLSALGRRQAAAAATALAAETSEIIFASPLRRARETAEIISQRLGLLVETDPRLKEINVGIFQGKRRDELPRLYPEEFARWKQNDPDFTIPGGESQKDLERRGLEVFEAIRRSGRREAIVVAHGRLLIVVLRALMPDIADLRETSGLENGSITTLVLDAPGQAKLVRFNDVEHLANVGMSGPGDL
ncbi:MAG: phosphoglycerate mutase family protein [Thermoguttaceae bacterium]|nr:phosphoglycerate mutase family protein [Thermoguttaceae bacterium]